jgi:hypothetical protein
MSYLNTVFSNVTPYTYVNCHFGKKTASDLGRICKGKGKSKGKAVPLQAWSGPEYSGNLRYPYFVTTAQNGGRLSALRTGRFYPSGNTPGTHFC